MPPSTPPRTLVDELLVEDEDAASEMGARLRSVDAVSDATFKGCRFLLTEEAVEAVQVDSRPALRVQLACTLHPAQNSRFTWLELSLKFEPQTRVLSLVPEQVPFGGAIKQTQSVKATAGGEVGGAKFGVEASNGWEYSADKWKLVGSGAGTSRLLWTLREHPLAKDGIDGRSEFQFVVGDGNPRSCELIVTAKASIVGIAGYGERLVDLILGPRNQQRKYQLNFGSAE